MNRWDVFLCAMRDTFSSGLRVGWSWTLPTGNTEYMLITTTRTFKSNDGIFGNLMLDGSAFKCVTLENLDRQIPPGTYNVEWMWSDHFQQIMPHILVPGRIAIEVHWANMPSQLEGCIALGTEEDRAGDRINESKDAWVAFIKVVLNQPALKIKISEDFA